MYYDISSIFLNKIQTMNLIQVYDWVVLCYISCYSSEGLSLTQHCFSLQMIDGEAFLLLTQNDIVKIMNIKLGPALKIHNAILMFKSTDEGLKWSIILQAPYAVTIHSESITCLVFNVWTHQREREKTRTQEQDELYTRVQPSWALMLLYFKSEMTRSDKEHLDLKPPCRIFQIGFFFFFFLYLEC